MCWGLEDDRLRSLRGEERRRFFRARLHERDKGIWWLCDQPVALADMELDHVGPRAPRQR